MSERIQKRGRGRPPKKLNPPPIIEENESHLDEETLHQIHEIESRTRQMEIDATIASNIAAGFSEHSAIGYTDEDEDIQRVLEQIRQMEEQERLQYHNVQPAAAESFRPTAVKQTPIANKTQEYRELREEQDRAYLESLAADQAKERLKATIHETTQAIDNEDERCEDVPQTREQLRAARLKFFTK